MPKQPTYRYLLLRQMVAFLNPDGDLDHVDCGEAAQWFRARDAKDDAAVSLLVDVLPEQSDELRARLNTLLVRLLDDVTLDDAATLRDLLRHILTDAARAQMDRELKAAIDVPALRAVERDDNVAVFRRTRQHPGAL